MKNKYIPGDLVICNEEIAIIKGAALIPRNGYIYTTGIFWQDEEFLKPIPLTPDILEKNGWKIEDINTNDYVDFRTPIRKGIIFRAIKDKEVLEFQKDSSIFSCSLGWRKVNIRYVHELQHLLFSLGLNSEMRVF